MSRLRTLAEFVSAIDVAELPAEVVHHSRRALVDWAAAVLAGVDQPGARTLQEVVADVAGDGPCKVLGTSARSSAPFAALANGYASHLLDFDDVYNPSMTTIHVGSCVWPAVVAIGELRGLTGRQAVAAHVAGFEAGARVARALGKGHYESSWHVTGTAGHLAAAAAAARALGLSAGATMHAMGCATTQAAGIRGVYGSDSKPLHPGKAAMDGVLAALLAERGFTATDSALEGERGLLSAVTTTPDPAQLVKGLGTRWHILDNGHKLYPSASLTHPAIDAVLGLEPIDAGRVRAVEVRLAPFAADVTALRHPDTGTAAKFSTPHCVAVALHHRAALPSEFTDRCVHDPQVAALRDIVTVVSDPEQQKRGCRVRIELDDGTTVTGEVQHNRGTPAAPLTDGELEDKLVLAGDGRLGARRTDELAKACWTVDTVEGIRHLASLLVPTV